MMRRKRAYIPLADKLAAALACLLPQADRDLLRSAKARRQMVLGLFDWDHIELHSWGGDDGWWNLDPKLKAEHRVKSRGDTSRAFKAYRIDEKWKAFMRAMTKGKKPPKRKSRWPSRTVR